MLTLLLICYRLLFRLFILSFQLTAEQQELDASCLREQLSELSALHSNDTHSPKLDDEGK